MSEAKNAGTGVLIETRGPACWITINRPERRNALNPAVVSAIRQGLQAAQADTGCRVIVLTGSGDKAFCAGADLTRPDPAAARPAAVRPVASDANDAPRAANHFAIDTRQPRSDYADLLRDAHGCSLPIIARINGACMAGGMGLVAMADLAVAAEHARFGLPEVAVGVFPMQVMSLLKTLVAPRLVREWTLTGEPFTAHEALAAGLVNHVVPGAELDAKIEWLLGRLLDKSPTAIRRGRYALRAIESMSFHEAIAFTESQLALLALSDDAREGLAAFAETRKPNWSGT